MTSESWLNPKTDEDISHERFAKAMMKCQHAGAYCASDGFCHYGGDCFRSAKSSAKEAARMIRDISTESAVVQGWLNDAASYIERSAREGGE